MAYRPDDQRAPQRAYAWRWIGHALANTWRIFREHLAFTLIGLVGTAAALFVLAPVVLGPESEAIVSQELTLAALAALGSIVLVLLAVLVWSLLTAPAAMEFGALGAERARTAVAEAERDRAAGDLAEIRDRVDRSRLRVEVVNDSDPLQPVENSNAAMARFIQDEDRTLMKPLRQSQEQGPSAASVDVWDDGLRESRSEDEYISEVREYLTSLSQTWERTIAAAAVDANIAQLLLTVRNTGDIGYGGVEVEAWLPPGWNAAWDEGDLWEEDHPERPKVWGSLSAFPFGASFAGPITPTEPYQPGTIRNRENGVTVRWKPFDLPADRDQMLPPVRISIPESYAGHTVSIRWTAASVGGGRPVEGEVQVTVSATPASPAELLLPRKDD